MLKIAHKLQEEGKKYCIITPYDAQRTMIENEMKEAGLAWQEKCFNVDSFQGMSLFDLPSCILLRTIHGRE